MRNEYPTSSAQDQALAALGLKAENYPQAERILAACGLKVTPVRQGRKSVPSISLLDDVSGGWVNGDADYTDITPTQIDLTPVLCWIVEKDQTQAQKRIARAQAIAQTTAPAIDADALVAADNAAKDAEVAQRRADVQRQKDAREAQNRRRALLKAHGYAWKKIADLSQAEGDEWILVSPDGAVVTVSEALTAIAAK